MATPIPLDLTGKTALITGGSNGIGAAMVQAYARLNASIVIADLPSTSSSAKKVIDSLKHPARAIFVPVDITDWSSMVGLFKTAISRFGTVDIVVANAGVMETKPFFDFEVDEATGDLREDAGVTRVLDINLKGTMNTPSTAQTSKQTASLRAQQTRGSIVLISSTSGFFGGTSVVSYCASKHGVIGLLRASQAAARRFGIQVNGVAPFITPTFITEAYSGKYRRRGLPLNTPENVADVVVGTSLALGAEQASGMCFLVAGGTTREVEGPRNAAVASYMGEYVKLALDQAREFFEDLGGYPLPQARV
ncbi:uncharacterized protein A1O9_07511 [Exophiala aquamarina CBS 119918]|uniref:Ketoreductase domain-containing protein n=1 Tax=Exophiala aquamarina CBS 119918 TaxID=1182545 RepID=A0A072P7U6_9EURO|nr:uncharacterized protein A1O9_07511 [Exophiala aquamarina CBS 119918]KEF55931.1 hypothetical protein A1O9_07511 [Exophiala aquamarina CBS 119918]